MRFSALSLLCTITGVSAQTVTTTLYADCPVTLTTAVATSTVTSTTTLPVTTVACDKRAPRAGLLEARTVTETVHTNTCTGTGTFTFHSTTQVTATETYYASTVTAC